MAERLRMWSILCLLGCLPIPLLAQPRAAQTTVLPSPAVLLDSKAASKLVVREVKPQYPPLANVNYIQGLVRLEVRVNRAGEVTRAHVVSGHPFLAVAAIQAVREWRYLPLVEGGISSAFRTFVDVRFSLRVREIQRLPPEPEADVDRQVRPPEVLAAPAPRGVPGSTEQLLRLRVLVSDAGRAIDSERISGPPNLFDAAQEEIKSWKFKPARWGNHPVPWYLTVDVHVRMGTPTSAAGVQSSGL